MEEETTATATKGKSEITEIELEAMVQVVSLALLRARDNV